MARLLDQFMRAPQGIIVYCVLHCHFKSWELLDLLSLASPIKIMAHIKEFEHLKIQLEAIKSATSNFSDDNCIGRGGFGKVYKGEIDHSKGQQTMVAFKRLDRKFGQGDPEFWKEIMMLSFHRHENIVSLLGYCEDSGEKILVYELASKRSLDLYLKKDELTWVQRLKICIGAARGLAYLHTPVETKLRVLHRDIKSSNILLDENWNAKISDFGLSKFGPANQQFTYLISNAVGTHGYCDPLYAETGLLTKESDVYSFGVVLFEVLCGRLCIVNNSNKHRPLIGLVREYYEQNNIGELIYGSIKNEINPDSLKVFTEIAYQCLKRERKERPLMTNIVFSLESALEYQCGIAGILNVKILRGMKLKNRNPYVILKLDNDSLAYLKKSCVKHDNENPEWNEEFILYVENPNTQYLQIWVQNMASAEMHDFVGMASLDLSYLIPEQPETQTKNLYKEKYGNNSQGEIMVELVYKPLTYKTKFEDVCPLQKAPIGTPKGGGLFVVIIHESRVLQVRHHNNPSILLLFRGESRKTVTMVNTREPVWEEEFTFMLEQPPTNEELCLEVISTPLKGLIYRKEESMGRVNIIVSDVVKKRRIVKWYDLLNAKYGQLRVELQWRTSD